MFGRNWYRSLASRYATHRRRRRSPVRCPAFRSRLCEPLEERRLLSITVDTLVDEADGSIVDGDVSLRDAIALAAPGDTIDFSVTGTIELTLGELTVDKQLTIVGPGADLLTIDASGNDPTPDENNGDGSRVFSVDIAAPALPTGLSLSGLTLTGGDADRYGGAIKSVNGITLSGMVITDNSATVYGGGVWLVSNSSIVDTVFANNSSRDGGGLSILGHGGPLTNLISDTTFVGNVATRYGGGLYNFANQGELTVTGSTFYDNLAKDGGGIYNVQALAVTKIVNTTISANTATDSGGGINAYSQPDGDLTLENVTVTGNVANGTSSGIGGGGLFNRQADGPPRIVDTIIAGNVAGPGASVPDVWSSIRSSYSLIGIDTGASITDEGGSLIGTAAAPIDPLLGSLAPNGGATLTHALLPGSPAIDAGDPLATMLPAGDQRGAPFVREYGAAVDIGAYERQTVPGLNLVVDSSSDTSDGDYSSGQFSLREAVELANGSIGPDTIGFDPSVDGATITLSNGELLVVDATVIDASSLSGGLTIDASGNDPTPMDHLGDGSRVFNVDGATLASVASLDLRGATLTGGDVTGDGGAIRSVGSLSLTDTTVVDNYATGSGGGVLVDAPLGVTDVAGATISGNEAGQSGGGIFVNTSTGASTTISNSELSGNMANIGGGGWFTAFGAPVTISDSEVSGNVALVDAGGLKLNAIAGGVATLSDSNVSDNNAQSGKGGGVNTYALSDGQVTISGTTISGNVSMYDGGGVHANVQAASLSIDRSTISQNEAGTDDLSVPHGDGAGALLNSFFGGTITLKDTTVSGNTAGGRSGGVNVSAYSGSNLLFDGLTISQNVSYDNAAGIYADVRSDSTLAISRATISGNATHRDNALTGGGALYARFGGAILLEHSTVTENTIVTSTPFFTITSGLSLIGEVTIDHSIVAGNYVAGTNSFVDLTGDVSASGSASSYNLIGKADGGLIGISNGVNGNIVGGTNSPIDPMLGPLADNGGTTQTHALLPGSPAIDAGDPAFMAPPYTDQRGYYRVIDGDGDMTARIDIGAYEYGSVLPLPGDGNLDGVVDGADYLIWASFFGDDPAQVPPGSPLNGDFNGDGTVDGLDYILWAENYGQAVSNPVSTASAVVDAPQAQDAQVVDAALDGGYDTGSLVTSDPQALDWQISRAFASVLKQTAGRHAGQRRLDCAL